MKDELLDEILRDMRETRQYTGKDTLSPQVYAAMDAVQRHLFVPETLRDAAWDNNPLPIGEGQTISQPFIVALMTELLELPGPGEGGRDEPVRVLELGTGSGYQAAVLARIADEVYSIEVVKPLADRAAERLKKLGYANVHVRYADGTLGWPEMAPFDGIIVTAAGVEVPRALLTQLKAGARLVIPVGGQYDAQQLLVITRKADGSFAQRKALPVRFVPITAPKSGPS